MKRILVTCSCLVLVILAVGLGGCSDNTSPSSSSSNFTLTFAAPKSAGVGAAKAVAPDTFYAGADTLVLTSAQVVLREIELQACAAYDTSLADSSSVDSLWVEEFEAGPMLVDLPLGGAISQVLSLDVTPGTYSEVEFKVHPVRGDEPAAAAFLAAHPEFDGVSIRAEGTFNGVPFTFTTRMGAHQESDIDPALVVGDGGGPVNLTLSVDHGRWFAGPDSTLVDPSTAIFGGENRILVEHNIRHSFRAFEDRDHDGWDDRHGDPDGGHHGGGGSGGGGGGGGGHDGGGHHGGGMGH
jgi:uncharacterized membrane protein YgcG